MPDKPAVIPQPPAEPTPLPVTPEPPAAPVVPPTWRDGFTNDEYKTSETFKKYKGLDDMGKAHLELNSMIGKKGVILPNENDANDMERYYKQLGRPDESTKYENPEIQIEEEFKKFFSEDKLNSFKDIAFKNGLTQTQYEGLVKEYTESQLADIKEVVHSENKVRDESTKDLMNEWSVDFEANNKQSEMALRSFTKGISDEKLEVLMSDPDIKRLGFNIAKSVSEDSFKRSGGKRVETVQSLQAFIDSQVKTNGSSYHNQSAPDHKATKAKVREAYDRLEGLRKVGA